VGLLVLILVEILWLPMPFFAAGPAARPMLVVAQDPLDAEPLVVEMQVDERPWIVRDAEDVTYAQVDLSDPRWDDILTEPSRHADQTRSSADEGAGVLISAELMRSIQASQQRSDDDNRRSLAELSGRLTQVSSEETIDELSGTIGRLVGSGARETRPKENVEGPFDTLSAQPHDCKKLEANGKPRYVLVMVDKAGRTQEVELDEASGEQMYKTMQLIKSNPLLERVYRGVVMGILDKMLAPQQPK